MTDDTYKPIVYLSAANDRQQSGDYLRNLARELDALRPLFEKAEASGYCEPIERQSSTPQQILNVFNDYINRIVIFHYAGHADKDELLLETETGEQFYANAKALADFLQPQHNLKLVFLNACSTKDQAQEFIKAGVPVVIATSRSVGDALAKQVAEQFYKSMTRGETIGVAYDRLKGAVKFSGEDQNRNARLVVDPNEEHGIDGCPWQIYVNPNAKNALDWSLPEAAGNPCFGLPDIPKDIPFPAQPFIGPQSYGQEHAKVFFGRCSKIREIYNCILDENSNSPIWVYGPSGAGKSSLLSAGLIPRLREGSYKCIAYFDFKLRKFEANFLINLEYQQEKSILASDRQEHALLGKLSELLQQCKDKLLSQGLEGESTQLNKPSIIILDQVEQIFTTSSEFSADELSGLLAMINELFPRRNAKSGHKLILSFRKDFFPEFRQHFSAVEPPLSHQVYVVPLDRDNIVDVVLGAANCDELKLAVKYKYDNKKNEKDIEQSKKLAQIIADNLVQLNLESSITPTLQILLTEMWEKANKDEDYRVFDFQLFDTVRHEGLGLDTFLSKQLQELSKKSVEEVNNTTSLRIALLRKISTFFSVGLRRDLTSKTTISEKVVETGLALDILYFHTTELVYAKQCSLEELYKEYKNHSPVLLEWLVREFNDLYLLTLSEDTAKGQKTKYSSLAHDQLARVVRERFVKFPQPGQDARRILESRAIRWKGGKKSAPLDPADLKIVLSGRNGMRNWTADERRLIEASRFRRGLLRVGMLLVLMGVILLIVSIRAWVNGEINAFITDAQSQVNNALTELDKDPYQTIKTSMNALPSAIHPRPYVAKVIFPLTQGVRANLERHYLQASSQPLIPERVALTKNGEQIAFVDPGLLGNSRNLTEIGISEWSIQPLEAAHGQAILGIEWNEKEDLLSYDTSSVVIWPSGRSPYIKSPKAQFNNSITCAHWRPKIEQVLICAKTTLWLWTYNTGQFHEVPLPLGMPKDPQNMISIIDWSQDGSRLAAAIGNDVLIWKKDMLTPDILQVGSDIEKIAFANLDSLIVKGLNNDNRYEVTLWAYENHWQHSLTFNTGDDVPLGFAISPNGQWLLIFLKDTSAGQLWDLLEVQRSLNAGAKSLDILPSLILRGHNQIEAAAWHPSQDLLATGGRDGTIRIWKISDGQELAILRGHTNRDQTFNFIDIYGVHWLDAHRLLSYGEDGTFRVWQVLDQNNVPLCAGFDYERFPRCHDNGWTHQVYDNRDVTYAEWLTDGKTIITSGKDGSAARLSFSTAGGIMIQSVLTDTRFASKELHTSPKMLWNPQGNLVLTYLPKEDWDAYENRLSSKHQKPDEELRPGLIKRLDANQSWKDVFTITGTIASAFWSDMGLLVSRTYTDTGKAYTETVLYRHSSEPTSKDLFDPKNPLPKQTGIVNVAEYTSTGLLAIGNISSTVYVWNVNTKDFVFTHTFTTSQEVTKISAVQWNYSGNRLLIAAEREISLWDIQHNHELWNSLELKYERENVHLAFSPDDHYVAASSGKKFVVVNALTGELIWGNRDHNQPILGIAWSTGRRWKNQIPGGPFSSQINWIPNLWQDYRTRPLLLLTWSGDGTARLWDVEAQVELIRMSHSDPGDSDPINVAAFNNDGSLVLTGDYLGSVYVWRTWQDAPEALLDEAQKSIEHRK